MKLLLVLCTCAMKPAAVGAREAAAARPRLGIGGSAIAYSGYTESPAAAAHTAVGLEVEHATEPLTVDTASPRFSWQLSHPQRAQRQLSFRVVVTMAVGSDDVLGPEQRD